jgi:hypothetical protein
MSLGKKLFIGSSAAGACSADSVNPFDDGLTSSKALYQFDGNANDTVGNYNATASSGVTYTSGYIGQAATMGGNDSINTNDGGALLGDTWSISFFVKFDNANDYEYIAANWRSNPTPRITNWYLLKRNSSNSNVLEFNVYGSNGTNSNYKQFIAPSSSAFTSNTWYHIAISFNGSSATDVGMYINGLPVSYTTNTGSGWDGSAQISTTLDTTIGALSNSSGGSNYLDGQIDQVRFFNKAISDAEAVILGNETTDTASDVNVLNDGSGVALYSLDYDASDAGGNYDGTANNVEFGVGGHINYGADFNGSSSYIQTTLSPSFETISHSLWFYADNADSTNFLYYFDNRGGRIDVAITGTGSNSISASSESVNITATTATSQFNHLSLVYTGWASSYSSGSYGGAITVTAYLNGSPIGTANPTPYGQTTGMRIGRSGGSYYFEGKIDQVRVFQKALSSTEVSTLYGETACVYTSTTDVVGFPPTAASNLFAYYKLDNSGVDETGNHDGTQGSSTAYSFGRLGEGGDFDGSNNAVITIPDSNKFSPSVNDFSVSFWFNVSNTSANRMVAKGSNPYEWEIRVTNGQPIYVSYNSPGSAHGVLYGGPSPGAYSDGNWHHMVVTHDHLTKIGMFVDNTSIGTLTTFSGSMSNTNSTVTIGKRGDLSTSMIGRLDQFRFYDKILTTNEIGELYNEKPEVNTSNFETVLYNGTASDRYVSTVGFQPDLVWIKRRNSTNAAVIQDSVRGENNYLMPSSTNAQASNASFDSFEANGFELTGSGGSWNNSTGTYVAWCWKGGGDAVNNTNGTIGTSQVSANQDAGFSIVKYTGTGSNATVGHGLSSAPQLVIAKRLTDAGYNWAVYSSGMTNASKYMWLNHAAGEATGTNIWNSTDPTPTVFSIGTSSNINALNKDYIAYCFHSVTGYQKIGSYTGNNPTASTTMDIDVGFTPRFVLLKNVSTAGPGWNMYDNLRGSNNIWANSSNAEADYSSIFEIINNGFRLKSVNTNTNFQTNTFIYLAIA